MCELYKLKYSENAENSTQKVFSKFRPVLFKILTLQNISYERRK